MTHEIHHTSKSNGGKKERENVQSDLVSTEHNYTGTTASASISKSPQLQPRNN